MLGSVFDWCVCVCVCVTVHRRRLWGLPAEAAGPSGTTHLVILSLSSLSLGKCVCSVWEIYFTWLFILWLICIFNFGGIDGPLCRSNGWARWRSTRWPSSTSKNLSSVEASHVSCSVNSRVCGSVTLVFIMTARCWISATIMNVCDVVWDSKQEQSKLKTHLDETEFSWTSMSHHVFFFFFFFSLCRRDFMIFQEPGKPAVNITDNNFKDKVRWTHELCLLRPSTGFTLTVSASP